MNVQIHSTLSITFYTCNTIECEENLCVCLCVRRLWVLCIGNLYIHHTCIISMSHLYLTQINIHSSFSVMHKVGNVGILYCLYLKIIKIEKSITSIWIQSTMVNVHFHSNWFSSQVFLYLTYIHQKLYKKCQCCQFCVLRENSSTG